MKYSLHKQNGFTLIEIMIVVGIVALLATFAVPQMLRSRMNANETAAIGAMRTISNAAQAYYNDIVPHAYPATLLALAGTNPAYIDSSLGQAITVDSARQGYYYSYNLESSELFTVVARPSVFGRTAGRNFFVNEIGVLTSNRIDGTDPDENSTPVE